MAAETKEKLGHRVKYLFAVTVTDELIQEAIEALASGGIAVIRRQVAKALETAATELSTANPGPDGVGTWLARFTGSACAAVAEELAELVSGQDRLLNPRGEAEFMDALNDGLGALAVGLTRSVDDDFTELLRGLYAAMGKSVKQARRVDYVVEWVAGRGIGQMGVHPWLKEATVKLQPHRILLKVLGIGKEQVEGRCRSEWNRALTGLLDHNARRLTSELSIMWTQHLYRCHDRYLEDMGRVLSRLGRERLFA